MADLDDQWLSGAAIGSSVNSALSWATVLSQTRISTVDGLGLSETSDPSAIHSLGGVLQIVERLKLRRYAFDQIEELREIAQGETFKVSECRFDAKVIAVKHIKLEDKSTGDGRHAFQKRLHSVLREISIMHHSPLAHHPNIIDLYGYGWRLSERRPAPYIVLEYGEYGSLRNYLLESKSLSLRAKLIFAGDVACGLMALHQCGIVHGDVKLDNVIVFPSLDRPSGCIAKICDFGHSLLLDSDGERQLKYFGTSLYNAPEVALQETAPIPRELLHKCDIWAYGLLVWEVLTDGSVFFRKAWRRNSAYARSTEDSLMRLTTEELGSTDANDKKEMAPSVDAEEEGVFGRFDIKHIRMLAKQHVSELKGGADVSFAKSFLKPLFERTLQEEPGARLSDLTRLPIVGMWNKAPGNTSMRTRLAMYAGTSTLTYDIFRRELERYFLWGHQVQLLQDFESLCAQHHNREGTSNAAFQTAMCYLNGFGTSCDHTKATQYLRRADEEGHRVAKSLNPQILGAVARLPPQESSYLVAVRSEVARDRICDSSKQIRLFRDANLQGHEIFANCMQLKHFISVTPSIKGLENWELVPATTTGRLNILATAVAYDDPELMKIALENTMPNTHSSNSGQNSALLLAAERGDQVIMNKLVECGIRDVSSSKPYTIAHLVFCYASENDDLAVRVLQYLRDTGQSLDTTFADIPVHPQWPLRLHGTPLAVAIAAGSLAGVQALLDAGADPLTVAFGPDDGISTTWTPLHLAVCYHFPEMVRAFIDNAGLRATDAFLQAAFPLGCAFSYSSPAQRFALHSSTYLDKMTETISLIPSATLILMSPQGKSPLTQAIDFEDNDAVNIILLKYPKLALKAISPPGNREIFTYPLHYAAKIGSASNSEESLRVVQRIWEAAPHLINIKDSSGATAMHMTASGVSKKISEFLAAEGANVNAYDANGQTPLHLCCFEANAAFLLDCNANHDALDFQGFSPAHMAAMNRHIEPLRELIRKGADLESSVNDVGTPLHCAVVAKSREMVSMILEAKANANARNRYGNAPLHVAIEAGRADLAILLLEADADPLVISPSGLSPLVAAVNAGLITVLKKILHLHVDRFEIVHWQQILHTSAKTGDTDLLEKVLHEYGKRPDTNFDLLDEGETPLHTAASSLNIDAVRMLLKHGASLGARDVMGNTALLLACQSTLNTSHNSSRAPLCEFLISSGADIFDWNYAGQNTLYCANQLQDFALMTYLILEATRMTESSPRDPARTIASSGPLLPYFNKAPVSVSEATLVLACDRDEYDFIVVGVAYNLIDLRQAHHWRPFEKYLSRYLDYPSARFVPGLTRVAKAGDRALFQWVVKDKLYDRNRWVNGRDMVREWDQVNQEPLSLEEIAILPSWDVISAENHRFTRHTYPWPEDASSIDPDWHRSLEPSELDASKPEDGKPEDSKPDAPGSHWKSLFSNRSRRHQNKTSSTSKSGSETELWG